MASNLRTQKLATIDESSEADDTPIVSFDCPQPDYEDSAAPREVKREKKWRITQHPGKLRKCCDNGKQSYIEERRRRIAVETKLDHAQCHFYKTYNQLAEVKKAFVNTTKELENAKKELENTTKEFENAKEELKKSESTLKFTTKRLRFVEGELKNAQNKLSRMPQTMRSPCAPPGWR